MLSDFPFARFTSIFWSLVCEFCLRKFLQIDFRRKSAPFACGQSCGLRGAGMAPCVMPIVCLQNKTNINWYKLRHHTEWNEQKLVQNGPSGTPVPTNSLIAQFISTFKRFSNKEYEKNIWQPRSYDHIIRGEKDYQKIWEYIDTNVVRWKKDCFYID